MIFLESYEESELNVEVVRHSGEILGTEAFTIPEIVSFSVSEGLSDQQTESGITVEISVGTVSHVSSIASAQSFTIKSTLSFSVIEGLSDQQTESGVTIEYIVGTVTHTEQIAHPVSFSIGPQISCSTVDSSQIDISLDTPTVELYDLYRNGTLIASDLAETDFPYSDTGLTEDTSYDYHVIDGGGLQSNTTSCSTFTTT